MPEDTGFAVFAGSLVLICVALIGALVYFSMREQAEWNAFKVSHKCVPVARIKGQVAPTLGVSSSGKMVSGISITNDQVGYLCNDGVTYYR